MNVRPRFVPVASEEARESRTSYLDGLPFCQDALLEVWVGQARFHRIELQGTEAGHLAVHPEHGLVEFHIRPDFGHLGFSIFRALRREAATPRLVVKSFDAPALSYGLDLATKTSVLGMLVREYRPEPLPDIPRIRYEKRTAKPEDLPRILRVDQQVFNSAERLEAAVANGEVLLFEREDRLVGFGLIRPIISGRRDREVGIAVDAPFRNKGFAAYILRDLADTCVEHDLNPVSGVAIGNEASIRLGQRIGFRAYHRLLALDF